MENSIRIAKALVRIARQLVADDGHEKHKETATELFKQYRTPFWDRVKNSFSQYTFDQDGNLVFDTKKKMWKLDFTSRTASVPGVSFTLYVGNDDGDEIGNGKRKIYVYFQIYNGEGQEITGARHYFSYNPDKNHPIQYKDGKYTCPWDDDNNTRKEQLKKMADAMEDLKDNDFVNNLADDVVRYLADRLENQARQKEQQKPAE